jgi:uncharacterized protein (DUF362 family)
VSETPIQALSDRRTGRREFCAAAVGGIVSSGLIWPLPKLLAEQAGRARVVLAHDDAFWPKAGTPRASLIRKSLDQAMVRLTGQRTARAAWKRLFKPKDRVLVKLNCLAGRSLSTRPEIVEAVTDGVHSAGVPWRQIILWERLASELKEAGYAPRSGGGYVQVVGADQINKGIKGYEPTPEIVGSVGSCFSLLLTRWATAVVNVPILKDHNLAGVSGGMKNFYGAIHNPNKYHDNNCDPYIADLCTAPHIRNKLRLIVCDALKAQCENGPAFSPAYAWRYNGFLVSLDPVAIDAVGAQIIDRRRQEQGLKSLAEAGRAPVWIRTAAQRGLGEADLARIETIRL